MVDSCTDPKTLIQQAYATDEQLAIRVRTYELYIQPKVDFQRWVVDTLAWRGDEWVLDVGAGPGGYFELVQERIPRGFHVAGDLSFGMVRQAQANPHASHTHLLNLDAQHLPFPDHTFDVVLANHMLYHVPDIQQALFEIRRVLRPDGCLVAATNSEGTMPELDTLTRRACTLLGYPKQRIEPEHTPFALENGVVQLGRIFRAVARYDLPGLFLFSEVEPVLAYVNSLRVLRESQLPEEIEWDEFVSMMEKQIVRLIRHFGELEVHKLSGVLVATNGGGFAAEYLRRLDQAG